MLVYSIYTQYLTINLHLSKFNSQVAKKILGNIYVDVYVEIFGTQSEDDAIKVYREEKESFEKASMNLREWISNSQTFMNALPQIDRASGTGVKVLGTKWDVKDDIVNPRTK